MELELKHFIDAYKYKTPCSLSRVGIFNLDLEYPDSRYEDIGYIDSISIRADGNISGELRLKNGLSVDFDFNINEEHDLVLFYRPLSDLTKPITVNGETFVPYDVIEARFPESKYPCVVMDNGIVEMSFWNEYQKLLEWHFDIFGLIPAGLAIVINTLNE